jgi:hypothetical protein
MKIDGGPWRVFGVVALFILFISILCWLPYKVPVAPSVSVSYVFGYNNRVGVALVGLGALLVALFARDWASDAGVVGTGRQLDRSTFVKALMGTLVVSLVSYLLTRRWDGYSESIYTVDRVKLVLEGHLPYRDFEFAYGPLLLYGPAWMARALHISPTDACGVFWIGLNLIGVWELYTMLRWTEFSGTHKRLVFVTIWGITLFPLFSTGSGYSLIRFVTAGFLAMAVQRWMACARTERGHAALLLLPIPCTMFSLSISPEMGLACAAGLSLYLLRFGGLGKPLYLASYAAMLGGALLVLLLAHRFGEFVTLGHFSAGGSNYPNVPAPHLLVFFAALAVAAGYAGERARSGQGSALLALLCVSAATLPAALGRCDPGHVLLDGIGILLAGLLIGGAAMTRTRIPAYVFLLVFFLVPLVNGGGRGLISAEAQLAFARLLPDHARWVERAMVTMFGPAKASARMRAMYAVKTHGEEVNVAALFHASDGEIFAAPFGFNAGHTGIYHSPVVEEGYYLSTVNVASPADVARKILELSGHPARRLLLLSGAEYGCMLRPEAGRLELEALFIYRYRAAPVHAGNVMEPLCSYIRTNYHVTEAADDEHFGYAVWSRD